MKVMTALLLFVAILFLPVIALAQGNGAALSKKFDSYLDTSGDKGGRDAT